MSVRLNVVVSDDANENLRDYMRDKGYKNKDTALNDILSHLYRDVNKEDIKGYDGNGK